MKFETTPTAISSNHDYPPVESLGVVDEEHLTSEQLTRVEAFIDPWHQKKIIEAARLLQVHRPLAQMHSSEYEIVYLFKNALILLTIASTSSPCFFHNSVTEPLSPN